ncbi:extracellular solute-binding protein [Clostridium manihotivorum]|uniref:Sugar ABC transporter substrate-binding protein n=1 Tax=Clostridium manihotivorum TaxID=2320868 RepID=A0A3R5U8Z5_9CLOT|nr:extracellular solute-binding protein [Clostridium manihotivorum]QAA32316.1 sugar ABC transporter substrate-binding protein [Clostridium manihotivorum]
MKKKKVLIVLLLAVIVVVLGSYPIIFKRKPTVAKEENVLKLYVLGSDENNYDRRIQAVVREYEKKYTNIKIKVVVFNASTSDGVDNYVKKMLTDTLADDGPDILVLDSQTTRKLEKADMLVDLGAFIEKDRDFKKEDYNMKVIEGGKYKGKQVIMPFDYYVNQYITTEELLKKNNLNLQENYTEKQFIKELSSYIASASKDRKKLLFANQVNIEDFIEGSGVNFIDYDSKKAYFDKPEFKEIVEDYKKIYNSSKKDSEVTGRSGTDGFEALKNGTALLSNDPIDMRDTFFPYESLIKQTIKENLIINVIPGYSGGERITPIVNGSLAISKNAKNKAAAYNFIKLAISEEIQKNRQIPFMIPVNKKAARELEQQYIKNEVNSTFEYSKSLTVVKQPLSENFKAYYDKIIDQVDEAKVTNSEVENMMMECLTPYFEDKASYETCLKILENKINLYLNE